MTYKGMLQLSRFFSSSHSSTAVSSGSLRKLLSLLSDGFWALPFFRKKGNRKLNGSYSRLMVAMLLNRPADLE
jgi:hypothetical protein